MIRFLIPLLFLANTALGAGTTIKILGNMGVATKTGSYPIQNNDTLGYIIADTSGGAATITLPVAGSNIGRQITIEHKSGDSNNACVYFSSDSDLVDGRYYQGANAGQSAGVSVFCLNDGDKVTFAATLANNWKVMSYYYGGGNSSRNYLANGNMELNQRAWNGGVTSGKYTLDRWYAWRGSDAAGHSVYQTGPFSDLPGFRYGIIMERAAGYNDTLANYLVQALETIDSMSLQGKTVTFSGYMKKSANWTSTTGKLGLCSYTGTGSDQGPKTATSWTGQAYFCSFSQTAITSWQRFSMTYAIPSNATQAKILFYTEPTGANPGGGSDWIAITGVQLNEGPLAIPFRLAGGNNGGEQTLAQRYYQVLASSYLSGAWVSACFGIGKVYGADNAKYNLAFPVTMRRPPGASGDALTIFGGGLNFSGGGGTVAITVMNVYSASTTGARLTPHCTGLNCNVDSTPEFCTASGSYSGLAFDAELY